ITITASHNPAPYNGLKIKAHFGGSAPPELYSEVEKASLEAPGAAARTPGKVEPTDLLATYREGLGDLVDLSTIRRARLTVLADAMHGAAGTLLTDIVGQGGTKVLPFRAERDVLFGGVHPEPIAAHLSAASKRVRESGCDLAVACDGDADRLGVLDRGG